MRASPLSITIRVHMIGNSNYEIWVKRDAVGDEKQYYRYTYRHNAVLSCLLSELRSCLDGKVEIVADLDGKHCEKGGI